MKKFFIIISCVALCIPACKKDEKSKTKTELITNGSWHVTAYSVDPAIDYMVTVLMNIIFMLLWINV